MIEFVKVLLSLSISGTLLLLLTFLFKTLCKDKFSKRWQYYIWLIVAVRFILPFTPNTTIVGGLFERMDAEIVNNVNDVSVPDIVEMDHTMETQTNWTSNVTPINTSNDKSTYIFFVWISVAMVLFIRKVTIYQGFIRYVKAGNTEVSDIELLNLLSDCEENLNIKSVVELYHNPLIASPILIGFIRPSIVIPTMQTDKKELSYIFTHELIHYKRRDMFYKWFIQTVICIHWFNPFVYLLGKEVNRACELSCDETAIYPLDDKSQREYGDTLLSSVKTDKTYRNSLASLTLTEGAEQLQERLGAIMNFTKKSKKVYIISLMTVVLLAVSSMVIGAYAAPGNDKDKTDMISQADNINKVDMILSTGYKVQEEDGIYYIFCDGADESDKPTGVVTEGNIAFTLVRKDSYSSISGFTNLETLVDDVTEYIATIEFLSTSEKEAIIEVATKISNLSLNDITENDIEYNVLTCRLEIENAPKDVQTWVQECNSKSPDIFICEYNNRYWIYTNTIGANNNFSFEIASNNAGEGTITIIPNNEDGNGYALLSAPTKYTDLFVNCGDYTAEAN